ncbi:hypothetical protein AFM40_001829 [Escherichia coli]|uniref:DUF7940 domain-containing protein n=1 Tax=Escherichia coli TaxID=562 RepID=UPI000BE5B583|nr:hypothetical protein [Escherichia coli]EFJ5340451.1 hypothetical protein [Escherichia coli]HEI3268265.1 hypothetical protein [Escherichia coli]
MNVIPQWRYWWRFYSTHALVIASVIPLAMDEAEAYLGESLPFWLKLMVALVILVSGVTGRLIVQVKEGEHVDTAQRTD